MSIAPTLRRVALGLAIAMAIAPVGAAGQSFSDDWPRNEAGTMEASGAELLRAGLSAVDLLPLGSSDVAPTLPGSTMSFRIGDAAMADLLGTNVPQEDDNSAARKRGYIVGGVVILLLTIWIIQGLAEVESLGG